MISFKNFSIRRKITFIILVVTFVSGGVGSILDALGEYSLSKEKLVTESSMVATLVSEYCITPLDFGYQDEAVANLAKLATIPSIYNGIVFDIDGNVFAEYDRYLGVSTETIASGESYSRFEDEWLHVLRPIEYKGEKKGAIYLRVSTFEISQRLQYHLLSMVVIGLGVMVIAFLLATSLQKLISPKEFHKKLIIQFVGKKLQTMKLALFMMALTICWNNYIFAPLKMIRLESS